MPAEQHPVPSPMFSRKLEREESEGRQRTCRLGGLPLSPAHAGRMLASCCHHRADSHCGKSLPGTTVSPKHRTWAQSGQKPCRWQRSGDLHAHKGGGIPPPRPLGGTTGTLRLPFQHQYTQGARRPSHESSLVQHLKTFQIPGASCCFISSSSSSTEVRPLER